MPQGNGARRDKSSQSRDNSPAANRLRSAVAAQRGAREGLKELAGSPLSRMKLKREVAGADKAAYEAAMAYRKTHAARDRARANANRTTEAQLDQFEAATRRRK